jgi:hypothetical protein
MNCSKLREIKKEIDDYQRTIDTLVKERQKKIFQHNFIKYFNWDFKKFGDFHLEMTGPTSSHNDMIVSFKLIFQGRHILKSEYLTFNYHEFYEAGKTWSTIECDIEASLEGHLLLTKRNIMIPVDLTACDRSDYTKLLQMAMDIRNSSELIV